MDIYLFCEIYDCLSQYLVMLDITVKKKERKIRYLIFKAHT